MTMPLDLGPWSKYAHTGLVVTAVLAVAVADVCLKRATQAGAAVHVLRSPWLAAAVVLYLAQVALFVVVFAQGWKLSVVSLMQTALYATVTLAAGVLLFGEALSLKQALGVALALAGALLLSQ
jgi:drug/metabolite transporter (DMT)-like permease